MNTIAILLTTYNGEKYITELLVSLENQSDNSFDLFIRDDGSTDRTIERILSFQSDSNLSIILLPKGENIGASQNFAYLLQHALKYEQYLYLMFCDQDDVWLPDKIEQTQNAMSEKEKNYPATPLLIHTDLQVVDENLGLIDNSYWSYQSLDPDYDSLNRLLIQNVITGCTIMINRALAEIALPIPKEAIMHDWWLGLVAASLGRIESLPQSTIKYRQHGANDIGASAFNISTIFDKAHTLFTFSLDKYTIQANSFLSHYSDSLDAEQKRTLEAFISIETLPWHKGKMVLLKYRFLKQHWIRNIGLLLCK
ncbi:MAG: glycosyltransferase family 2 protein [Campylobacterota bacterium]|nr:glycosyltransferase family 2 protein [Campylobacterota bacterium]